MPVKVDLVENRVELLAKNTITNIYQDYNSDERPFSRFHTHAEHEICICHTPSAIIFCGDVITRSGGDFAVFYPAGQAHLQLNHPHSIYRRFFVRYPISLLNESPESVDPEFFCTLLRQRDIDLLNPCIDMLLQIDRESDNHWKLVEQKHLIAFIYSILIKCRSENKEEKVQPFNPKEQRVFEICSYIHSHYNEKMTVGLIARSHFISRATVDRQFRDIMNLSITDYINRVRCNYAMGFLDQGHSVKEVSGMCGFSDQSYFIKVFKNIVGTTPHRYNKNQ